MLGGALLGRHEREHLDLVELVDAEDAPGVLAGRARLAPKARREPGVAERQRLPRKDLLLMKRGKRHLRGPNQVELIVGQTVDLLLRVGQKAGAVQGPLAHQHRRHDRLEALGLDPLERVAD